MDGDAGKKREQTKALTELPFQEKTQISLRFEHVLAAGIINERIESRI